MKNHIYWLGVNITLAKNEQKTTKKMKKADLKVLATRIIVGILAVVMVGGTLLMAIPMF